MASRSVYCICGQPYDSVRFMIQCDSCKDWYHGSCVNIKEHESWDIEKYHCVQCAPLVGPSIYKEVKNFHRHDYGDSEANGKPVQSGTPVFVQELRSRHFLSGEEVVLRLRGPLLNLPYLIQNGFNWPILVDSKVGLGIQVPSDTFTVSDVMDYVGPDFSLDVIDVTRQESIKMSMKEWVEYFNCSVRNKVYNVISLEFSKTKFSELVKPPTIVQKLSWVENYWPKSLPESFPLSRPSVMKYCLMSAQDSYTDFHVDFGGTSVWYHILRGEKVFFLVRPTQANLTLYEHWTASSNQSETFFGDQVDACYQLVLTQGQTLFIPTGWIHAVFTPVDSLVFGGNFLHTLNIPLQLQIHEIERRVSTPEKYKFPSFETVHWFATPSVLEQLKDSNVSKWEQQYLVVGAKALISVLKVWSSDNHKHEDIPPGINAAKLIKDLQREIRTAEKFIMAKNANQIATKKPPPRLRKQKDMDMNGSDSDHRIGVEKAEPTTLKFSLTPNLMSRNEPSKSPIQTTFVSQVPKVEFSQRSNQKYELPAHLPAHLYNPISWKEEPHVEASDFFPYQMTEMQPVNKNNIGNVVPKKESVYDFVDSDEDNLVVDENPPKSKCKGLDLTKHSRAEEAFNLESKANTIKLKFSLNGKTVDDSVFKHSVIQHAGDEMAAEPPKNATIDDLLMATGLVNEDNSLDDDDLSGGRTSPSTREAIQGMLSISKSAFLFTNPNDPNAVVAQSYQAAPASIPTTAEPNQFSLAETAVANFSILAKKSAPQPRPSSYESVRKRKMKARFNDEDDEEFEESLKQCHQDSDYIYLGLEATDDDYHVFKPRGKNRRDGPWNPKAKLVPNCPKPERPVREGVRKEAIETGLAAAAAKLSTTPTPKRQYTKKKVLPSLPPPPPPTLPSPPPPPPQQQQQPPLPPPKAKEVATMQQALTLQPGPSPVNKPRPFAPEVHKVVHKRPKKGFATPKQRLGKILKIHKMLY